MVAKGKTNNFDQFSQPVHVPIDDVQAITLKVSPTFDRDQVESVTLKSFRKVLGFDTFHSILMQNRDEEKDSADHYNVTLSLMVKRIPEVKPVLNSQGEKLVDTLDKGFPYDDGDNTITDAAPMFAKDAPSKSGVLLGKLNGENVTSEALKNLVTDSEMPLTVELVELEEQLATKPSSNVTAPALKKSLAQKKASTELVAARAA